MGSKNTTVTASVPVQVSITTAAVTILSLVEETLGLKGYDPGQVQGFTIESTESDGSTPRGAIEVDAKNPNRGTATPGSAGLTVAAGTKWERPGGSLAHQYVASASGTIAAVITCYVDG